MINSKQHGVQKSATGGGKQPTCRTACTAHGAPPQKVRGMLNTYSQSTWGRIDWGLENLGQTSMPLFCAQPSKMWETMICFCECSLGQQTESSS